MTREEATVIIKVDKIIHKKNEPRAIYISEALDMAIKALEQEPCEVSECDKDHIWYKGRQYISLRRFSEVKAEAEQAGGLTDRIEYSTDGNAYKLWISSGKEFEQGPCDDCISRKEAVHALRQAMYDYEDRTEAQFIHSKELDAGDWYEHRIFVQNMNDIDVQTINDLPSVTPKPKEGHWIVHPKGIYAHLVCDKCLASAPYNYRTNYCPNCGAKMSEIPTGSEGSDKE